MTDPVTVSVSDEATMVELGIALGRILQEGDLILLAGPLGAGKTAFVRGVAAGLGVRGPITSPTFVLARVHPSLVGGPNLVHVDAYRIAGVLELDDLDLDADLEASVIAIEWGSGVAEGLATNRLDVMIERAEESDERAVTLTGHGPRWSERWPDFIVVDRSP